MLGASTWPCASPQACERRRQPARRLTSAVQTLYRSPLTAYEGRLTPYAAANQAATLTAAPHVAVYSCQSVKRKPKRGARGVEEKHPNAAGMEQSAQLACCAA